jgi:hypothetical protein
MAHFTRVVDGKVLTVHVVANAVITDENGVEQEALGQQFLADLHGYEPNELVQCSYNMSFRGKYPGPGDIYDSVNELFLPVKPSQGEWVLDESTFSWVEVEDEAV